MHCADILVETSSRIGMMKDKYAADVSKIDGRLRRQNGLIGAIGQN